VAGFLDGRFHFGAIPQVIGPALDAIPARSAVVARRRDGSRPRDTPVDFTTFCHPTAGTVASKGNMLTTIIAGAFVSGCRRIVHEFGHFIVAKLAGVYVKVFSIGFRQEADPPQVRRDGLRAVGAAVRRLREVRG
jgi:hypothetical protein